jgi:hypothetical protein
MLDTTHIQAQVAKIHSTALMPAAACRERTRRASILYACATSVSFVLRLFAKTRNLTFLSSVGFISHDNSDETSVKYFEVLQEYK